MPRPSWADCHAAGMTAQEAAQARGRCRDSAYAWAGRRGLRWPSPTGGVPGWAECHAAGMMAAEAAARRGRSVGAARLWARRSGLRWPPAPYLVPVMMRGVRYPSIAAAAAAAGVAPHTACYHLERHGHLDRLGIGRGGGSHGEEGRSAANRIPLRLGQQVYPSRRAAACALRVSTVTLHRWLRAGRTDLMLARALRIAAGAEVRRMREAAT